MRNKIWKTEANPLPKEGKYINSDFINGLNYKEAVALLIQKLEEQKHRVRKNKL